MIKTQPVADGGSLVNRAKNKLPRITIRTLRAPYFYPDHAPEVEYISKGKVHKRYDFGCKMSVAATSRGGWFVGAMAALMTDIL